MGQFRLLVVLFSVLLLGGVAGWIVVGGDDASGASPSSAPEIAVADAERDVTSETQSANAEYPVEFLTIDDPPEKPDEAGGRTRVDDALGEDVKDKPVKRAPEPKQARTGNRTETDKSTKKRKLTRAEREEQRRIKTGRPALKRRLKRTPSAVSAANALKRTPDQAEWDERWYNEGITPPEMTPTPVRGKIMSEQAREGLAKATVGFISFFPLDGVSGGKLLPVITELETDENGYFKGDIPGSRIAPLNYPRVGMAVSWEGRRVVTGIRVQSLEIGEPNELGIFWAPEQPYTLLVDASQFEGNLSVVSTGQLDPQRWHKSKRAEVLSYFPKQSVSTDGVGDRYIVYFSMWSGALFDTPYITLLDNSASVQTRRPKHTIVKTNGFGSQPFEPLVFENDGFTPINGQVVNADGAGLANAVVTTVGGLAQTVITDAAGWFFIEGPAEETHSLRCVHDDWVETLVGPVAPGDSDVVITLKTPRPRIALFVTDKLTQAPLTELGVKVTGLHPWGDNKGQPKQEQFTELTSTDGHFVLEWEFEIVSIIVEKIGYFPRRIDQPVELANSEPGQTLTIELSPGRKLEINPRDYTAVERDDRWFKDKQPTSPGIYTAWSHHWIEYEVDFGDAPDEGEQGGNFDMILGCTNHGIVDNQYWFHVDVYVDGTKKDTLRMVADSLHEQTARTSLGQLSGIHSIRLVWTNDKWIPNQLDANIRYQSLKFIEQP